MATLSSLLVHDEVVSVAIIEEALQRVVLEGGDIDTALLELNALPENVLNAYRAASYGLAPASRDQVMWATAEQLEQVAPELARQHRVVPIGVDGDKLLLAVAEPPDKPARDALRQALGREIELRVAVEVRIEAGLALHYGLDIPGRMRRLEDQLRTREAGALPVIRLGSEESADPAAEMSAEILRAFDSEPPAPPLRPVVVQRQPAPESPVVVMRPAVSVAPVVQLGAPVRRVPAAPRAPAPEAPPPPGVPGLPAPPMSAARPASAPPTSPAFAAATPSRLPAAPVITSEWPGLNAAESGAKRPPSAPTVPSFSAAPAAPGAPAVPAAPNERAVPKKPAPVRIEVKPISRPLPRRGHALPLGPLSAEAARERIEAASDRDAVIEVFFSFARQYFECTALFSVRDDQALGLEARGLADSVDIASVAIPIVKGSALDETERSRLPRVVDLSRNEADHALADALARRAVQPSALVPVLIRQRAVFVLYGDRDGAFFKVEDVADLVEVLPSVSRAFERIIRTRKVFAREARSRPRPELGAAQATPSLGPPLGTWGSAPVAAPRPDSPGAAEPPTAPVQSVPLEPAPRAERAPPWPPRPESVEPQEPQEPPAARERLERVSSPFVRAAPIASRVPPERAAAPAARVPPERALAPLGLSRDAPLPPRFAAGATKAAPTTEAPGPAPVTETAKASAASEAERSPTVILPRNSTPPPAAPEAAARAERLSNKPPPGTGSYSAEPPPAETFQQMRVPNFDAEPGKPRKTERPHRRHEETAGRPDTQPLRRSRTVPPPAPAAAADGEPARAPGGSDAAAGRAERIGVDPADSDDPRDTVRQRPAPVRRRNEAVSTYSVQDVRSELISVLPPAPDAAPHEPAPRAAAAPVAAPVAVATAATERSIIVDPESDLNGLVTELMRCGPDDEAPVLARIARVGEPALSVLVQRFPGPLWFDRRQSHQRLPRGRDVSAIARALTAFGERADRYLAPLLESPTLETRFYATLLAVDSLRPTLLPALAGRLFDPDAKIRLLVLDALGAYQHLPAFDAVLQLLRSRALDSQSSTQTRMTAVDALAQLRDVDSLELLIVLAAHSDRQLSVPAHRALVAITAQDFGTVERKWRSWLKKYGDQYRAEWLIEGLMHGDEKVRVIAGRELQELSQVYFGYVAGAPKRERERAQRRYIDWWRNEGLPALEAERSGRG
jgi:hypothetical protein